MWERLFVEGERKQMKYWQPNYELGTMEERKQYVEECIASGEYDLKPSTLERMGVYMLHPYDKEAIKKDKLESVPNNQKQRLKDFKQTGIKYRTPINNMSKEDKIKNYPDTKPYYDLIDYCDQKGKELLGEDGYTSIFDLRVKNPHISDSLDKIDSKTPIKQIYDGLHADISDTIQQYKKEIKIKPNNLTHHNALDDVEFDYTDEFVIREIIRGYYEIKHVANTNPYHIFSCIAMDIEKAIKECKLTEPQKRAINTAMKGKIGDNAELWLFYRACRKISSFFKKNKK